MDGHAHEDKWDYVSGASPSLSAGLSRLLECLLAEFSLPGRDCGKQGGGIVRSGGAWGQG
jgi:hypothetical protein